MTTNETVIAETERLLLRCFRISDTQAMNQSAPQEVPNGFCKNDVVLVGDTSRAHTAHRHHTAYYVACKTAVQGPRSAFGAPLGERQNFFVLIFIGVVLRGLLEAGTHRQRWRELLREFEGRND